MTRPIDYSKWDSIDVGSDSDSETVPTDIQHGSTPSRLASKTGNLTEPQHPQEAKDSDHGHPHHNSGMSTADVAADTRRMWGSVETRRSRYLRWLPIIAKLADHPITKNRAVAPDSTAIDVFLDIIKCYYSQGPELAALLSMGLQCACSCDHPFTFFRDTLPLVLDPDTTKDKHRAKSHVTSFLLAFVASPVDENSLRALADSYKPVLSAEAGDLWETLVGVEKNLVSKDDPTAFTLLVIDVCKRSMPQPDSKNKDPDDNPWLALHSLIVAANKEGIRVFQSTDIDKSIYTLDEWMAQGGSKLRPWPEAMEWCTAFKKATTYSQTFSDAINDAWKTCFSIDYRAATATRIQRGMGEYVPLVRIREIPDVTQGNLLKNVQWRLKEYSFPDPESRGFFGAFAMGLIP